MRVIAYNTDYLCAVMSEIAELFDNIGKDADLINVISSKAGDVLGDGNDYASLRDVKKISNVLISLSELAKSFSKKKKHADKLIDDLSAEFTEVFPQGFSIDVNHNVPVIDNIGRVLGGLFGREPASESCTEHSFATAFPGILEQLTAPRFVSFIVLVAIVNYLIDRNDVNRMILGIATGYSLVTLFYRTFILKETHSGIIGMISILYENYVKVPECKDPDLPMEEVFPQGNGGFYVASDILVVLFTTLVGLRAKPELSSAFNAFIHATPKKDGITSTLMSFSNSLSVFLTDVCKLETIGRFFHVDMYSDDEVTDLMDDIKKFYISCNTGIAYIDPDRHFVYSDIKKRAELLLKRYSPSSFDHRQLSKSLSEIDRLLLSMGSFESSVSGSRVEPVGVLFRGKPGVLKTVLMRRMATVVAQATVPDAWVDECIRNPDNFIYALPSDKYYDGYHYKCWVAMKDDIFQKREAVGGDELESLDVIKRISSDAYPLKMANVNTKNTMFYRSMFEMDSTNLTNFNHLHGIVDPGAVERRFIFTVDVAINEKYKGKKGKILPTHSQSIDGVMTQEIPDDFWSLKVIVRSVTQGERIMDDVSFEELAEMIVDAHGDRVRQYFVNANTNKHLASTISGRIRKSVRGNMILPQAYEIDLEDINRNQSKICRAIIKSKRFADVFEAYRDIDKSRALQSTLFHLDIDHVKFTTMVINSAMYKQMYGYLPCIIDLLNDHLVNLPDGERYNVLDRAEISMRHFVESTLEDISMDIEHGSDPVTKHKLTFFHRFGNVEFIKNTLESLWIFFKNATAMVLPCYLVFRISKTIIKAIYGFFKRILLREDDDSDVTEPQSGDFENHMSRKASRGQATKMKLSDFPKVVKPQGYFEEGAILPDFEPPSFCLDENKNNVMSKVYKKYLFVTYVIYKNVKGDFVTRKVGHCVHLRNKLFLAPFHFVPLLCSTIPDESSAEILLMTPNRKSKYRLPLKDFLRCHRAADFSVENDFCIFEVPTSHERMTGCLQYFITDEDYLQLTKLSKLNVSVVGSVNTSTESPSSLRVLKLKTSMQNSVVITALWESKSPSYRLDDVFMYEAKTQFGDCGSLVVLDDVNFQQRCLGGIHVAGDQSRGYAVVVTQNMILQLADQFDCDRNGYDSEDPVDGLTEAFSVFPQSGMVPDGYLEKHPVSIGRSEIRRSIVLGSLPEPFTSSHKRPAFLRSFTNNGILIDPRIQALEKYGAFTGCFNYGDCLAAARSYAGLLNSQEYDCARDVIPLRDAIGSFRSIPSISVNTSAGYPMNVAGVRNLKKEYFSAIALKDGSEEVVFTEILNSVNELLCQISAGKRPLFIYTDNLKDERRDETKVLSGNTRMFAGCPWLLLLLFRMYFGSFMDYFMKKNLSIGSAVGLNPYSMDWDTLARMLRLKGFDGDSVLVGAGDFSGFDATQQPILLDLVLKVILDWYGPGDDNNEIRRRLWVEVTNSRHVFEGHFYEWVSSLPSGNPMTIIINTIYLQLLYRVAWIILGLPIRSFNDHVVLVGQGDDSIYAVSEVYRDYFTEFEVGRALAEVGLKYTSSDKTSARVDFRKLEEVDFLKRGFRYEQLVSRWVAPLDFTTLIDMLNWSKRGLLYRQITVDNFGLVCSDLSLHGKTVFNQWMPVLVDIFRKHFPGDAPALDFEMDFRECLLRCISLDPFA